MPVLEQVVVVLSANTEEFVAKMQGAKTEMASLGRTATVEGEIAGAGLSTGMGSGVTKADHEIAGLGTTFGRTSKHIEHSSHGLGLFGTALGSMGGPLAEAEHKTGMYASQLERASSSGGILGGILSGLGGSWMTLLAGVAGGTAVLVHFGLAAQDLGTQIANSANITVAAGNKIVTSMQQTGGKTTFTGNELASAYAKVAGVLGLVSGQALTTGDSVKFMLHVSDLAEVSGSSLASTTKALADVMVAYNIKAKDAGAATDVLYNASRLTGVPVSSLAQSLQRLHSQLGIVTPPLSETAGLMADLTAHGLTGRSAISSLSSAYNHLLKPQGDVQVQMIKLHNATKAMSPEMLKLYKRYTDGTISTKEYKKELGAMSSAQQGAIKSFASANNHLQSAIGNLHAVGIRLTDVKGNFVGMGSVIEQTDKKLRNHTQAQQLAIAQLIFGAGVNRKFLATILAGPAAYKKYEEQVLHSAHAHAAAERSAGTMDGKIKTLKSSLSDAATIMGTLLMPYVVKVGQKLADVANWISLHWPQIMAIIKKGVDIVKPVFEALGKALGATFKWLIEHKPVLIAVLAAIGIAFGVAFLPFTSIAIGIIALVALIIKTWEPIKNFFIKIWEAIYDFFKPIIPLLKAGMDELIGIFKIAWSMIEAVFMVAWDAIMMVVQIAWTIISGFIKVAIATFTGNWSAAWNAVKGVFTGIWNAIKDFVIQVWNAIKGFFVGAFNTFTSMWTGVWNGIKDFLSGIWGKITGVFTGGIKWLYNAGKDILTGLWNGLTGAWGSVTGWFAKLPGWILNVLLAPDKLLFNVGKKIITGLWDGMKSIWKDVTNWFNDALGWLGLGGGGNNTVNVVNGQNISRTSGLRSFGGMSPSGVGTAAAPVAPHTSSVLHVTTPIQIDGRTIATAVTQYQLQNARGTGNALGRYAGGSQTATSTGTSPYAVPRG